jgi:acyl carrier protein
VFARLKSAKTEEIVPNIKITINKLLRDILELENITLDDTESLQNLEGWDSVTHITLVASLEDLYSFTFSLQELEEITTISNIASIIDRKLKA